MDISSEHAKAPDVPPTGREQGDDLSAAQRARHQAVELAERMLREVMGAKGDDAAGLATWQEAAMLRAIAEEERAFAGEEARRMVGTAEAEREEVRAGYEAERRQSRADLQRELEASRDAAVAEAEGLISAARQEAEEIVRRAVEKADETQGVAAAETQRLERRLAVLHTALADAEQRFRRLAATAANDVGTMQALIDEDAAARTFPEPPVPPPPPARPELYLAAVDLTERAMRGVDAEPAADGEEAGAETGSGFVTRDPDVGFYQRRLAGLRDRLEKSGHTPE